MIRKLFNKINKEVIWYSKYRFDSSTLVSIQFDYDKVENQLLENDIELLSYNLPIDELKHFIESNEYPAKYHGGGGLIYTEKCIEHFLSLCLLELQESDTYLDIASGGSPFPNFISRTVGCKVFTNDLSYQLGISEDGRIGGDATNLPLSNDSITKISLHCSLEHFE